MTCTYLRCPSDADGWAHLGGRWRVLCCAHLAGAAQKGAVLAGPDVDLDVEPPPPRERELEAETRTHPASAPVPCDPPRQPRRAVDVAFDTMVRPVLGRGGKPLRLSPNAPLELLLPLADGRCRCCPEPASPRARGLCQRCYKRAARSGRIEKLGAPTVPHTARRRAA